MIRSVYHDDPPIERKARDYVAMEQIRALQRQVEEAAAAAYQIRLRLSSGELCHHEHVNVMNDYIVAKTSIEMLKQVFANK